MDVNKYHSYRFELVSNIELMKDYGIDCNLEELECLARKVSWYIWILNSGCEMPLELQCKIESLLKFYKKTRIVCVMPEEKNCCIEPETYFIP